jgi:hypothetical protein
MRIAEVKERIIPILKEYGVKKASVFGSVARGDDHPKSDVDLVIRVGHLPFGIWGFVGLKQDLEEALGRRVDVVSETSINPLLAEKIKDDLTEIYVQ